ncbi:MAG TPA: hypothetical protein VF407_09495 [Polyangiaceae bacterium]
MYADPRPLFIVVGVVMFGLAAWVSYVLVAMREPWPVSKKLPPSDPPAS